MREQIKDQVNYLLTYQVDNMPLFQICTFLANGFPVHVPSLLWLTLSSNLLEPVPCGTTERVLSKLVKLN
jgi:hypothetical protein